MGAILGKFENKYKLIEKYSYIELDFIRLKGVFYFALIGIISSLSVFSFELCMMPKLKSINWVIKMKLSKVWFREERGWV